MLEFSGEKKFQLSAAEIWAKLSDARFLIQCIPDVEKVSRVDQAEALCTLRPGFSFVRGTLDLTVRIVDLVPNESARYLLHTKGIGTTSEVEANWSVLPSEDGSRLSWSVVIKSLGGLLKAVPQGLTKAAAQKVITDAWTAVEQRLAG